MASDADEPVGAATPKATLGEDLSRLSVDELEARIQALHGEVERVAGELERRRAHVSAADALFQSRDRDSA
ncbi:MAG: DUF1192 domain-containing protein [Pseudomonadota bacterium]